MEGSTLLFAVTIDTEIDKSPNWTVPNQESFRSVVEGVPKLLSPIFDKYEARPTYLLSPEVIANGESASVLRSTSNCELGSHLHGDVIEPQRRIQTLRNSNICEMQCSYSKEIEFGKLKSLTDLYAKTFGHSPSSFRAGRWGAGRNTIRCLKELGYKVDSSVSPGVCWNNPEGHADYRLASNQPYMVSLEDITEPGDSGILEVPTSIAGPSLRPLFVSSAAISENEVMMRLFNRALPLSWVTPVAHHTPRILHAVERIIRQNRRKDCIMVCMTFHSVDVIPKASPAARDEKEGKMILSRIENVLSHAKKRGFEFITLSEAYPLFIAEHGSVAPAHCSESHCTS